MPRNPRSRIAFVFALAVTFALAGAGAASADPDCRTVHGRFTIELFGGEECSSPIGSCGRVDWRGSLKADSEFVGTEFVVFGDTPATGTVLVTGDNVLVTADGEIYTKDAVLLATDGTFTEIDTIVGGTGEYAGASGSWIASGTSTQTDAEGSFVGGICWAS